MIDARLAELIEADSREEKLPRWARDRMERLRRAVRNAAFDVLAADQRADEARLTTRPEESDAVLNPYADVPIGLGKGQRVRFRPNAPDGGHIDVWVEFDEVRVMAPWHLAILPQSSNVAKIVSSL
ncbi:hypothetical protein ALI22I_33720 [Saccharothrix sp. ALI-22-I]|uniref:DUF7239 family protein n=1 Tax=Saccharothrix sp. ALI-22-I TaxID=1933778 RepID=UPI00097BAA14|nr:hypothetical protein [Saccharothrix sp. ALI-22-I]ONI83463.1 hypothetical protein ALI22I_33720 [Saccharothrix sp. ALI-22-I]